MSKHNYAKMIWLPPDSEMLDDGEMYLRSATEASVFAVYKLVAVVKARVVLDPIKPKAKKK